MSLSSDLLTPRFVLFFSVDITGSTAYKHDANTDKAWRELFAGFYDNFPVNLHKECDNIREQNSRENSFFNDDKNFPPPSLWKSIGDELLFYVEIANSLAVVPYVSAFRNAVLNYSKEIKRKENSLGCKATAWCADTTVVNQSVRFMYKGVAENSEQLQNFSCEDFIGPTIDRGFRISKYSSSEKFVISIELAYILTRNNTEFASLIHFDGKFQLKGVTGGSGYPIIWLDMEMDIDERELLQPPPMDKLRDFCKNYLIKYFPLDVPFIQGDNIFNIPSEEYNKRLKALSEEIDPEGIFDEDTQYPVSNSEQDKENQKFVEDNLPSPPQSSKHL